MAEAHVLPGQPRPCSGSHAHLSAPFPCVTHPARRSRHTGRMAHHLGVPRTGRSRKGGPLGAQTRQKSWANQDQLATLHFAVTRDTLNSLN